MASPVALGQTSASELGRHRGDDGRHPRAKPTNVKRRTYLDSSVLIAIAEGECEIAERALEILDDPKTPREFLLSEAVRLEVLPERLRNVKKKGQKATIDDLFERAAVVIKNFDESVWQKPICEATRYGIPALDALHLAAALTARADELITAEGPQKAICRTKSLAVVSLRKM